MTKLPILLSFLLVGCASTTTQVDTVYVSGVVQVAIGEFRGRESDAFEQDVREAIGRQDLFVIVAPERAERLRREYYRSRREAEWEPVVGADAFLHGQVSRHTIEYGESVVGSALGTREPTALVEVVFEMVDLRTGEVFGTRRVLSRVGPSGDIVSLGARIMRGRDRSSARLSESELLARARRNAVDAFVSAIRPDYNRSPAGARPSIPVPRGPGRTRR